MKIKINKNKYQKIDYARLDELVSPVLKLSLYDINMEADDFNWLQVFKENGLISIAHRVDGKVFQYFKLNEEYKVKDIIKEYFFDKKLRISQKPDEVLIYKNKLDINWLGLMIIVSSLIFVSIFNGNEKYINFGFLSFSLGMVITTYKKFLNKENDTRNDILFFGGIILFIIILLKIVL